jgi:hypothetical protein
MEIENPQHLTSRIGLVAAGWARFEYLTNKLIWRLANVDITVGACITAQILSPSNRLKALVALVRLRGGSEDLLKDIRAFARGLAASGRKETEWFTTPGLSRATKCCEWN